MTRFFLLFLACLCAGCASHTAAPTLMTAPSASAPLKITLELSPALPRSLDPTRFIVHITDEQGKPVTDAKVGIRLSMPEMDMGKNDVEAKPGGAAGTYAGTGRFTMSGKWQAAVTAKGGKAEAAQTFPMQVK